MLETDGGGELVYSVQTVKGQRSLIVYFSVSVHTSGLVSVS